jgi:cation diffusion facilitator family transporter
MSERARKVVLAAGAANLAIAVSKFVAYAFTGSSAMLTEAIHSVVDTGNQALLLVGQRRSARPPSATHQFGYGMEAFFWSFIVALMIFALGGAASIWEGLHQLSHPEPIRLPWISFAVLGLAMIFEGLSFRVAFKEYRAIAGNRSLLAFLHRSKDPNLFAVLLEDGAALFGLLIALAGTSASVFLDWRYADGVASMCIGLLLVAVAIFLANETRSLIAGEAASPIVQEKVEAVLAADPKVVGVAGVNSLHLGPNEILFAVTLDFDDALSGPEIEQAADALTTAIQAVDPRITRVFLRPGKPAPATPPA